MRRSQVISTLFITVIITAIAVIFLLGQLYVHKGPLFGGETTPYTQGWKTSDGNNVSIPGILPGNEHAVIELTNSLPADLPEGCVLFLRASYALLEIETDGTMLYSGASASHIPFAGQIGLPVYLVNIPASDAGKTIVLRLTSNHTGGAVSLYALTLGDGIAATVELVMANMFIAALFFILCVLFFIIFIPVLLFRKRITGQSSADALFFSAFIALAAIWMLSNSDLVLLFTRNTAVTFYCSIFSLMLLPVPILLFLRRFTHKYKKILNILTIVIILNFTVCLCLALSGTASLIETLFTSNALELLSSMALIVIFSVEFIRYRNDDSVEVIIGLGLLCIMSIISVLLVSASGNSSGTIFFHIGLVSFVLAMGAGVIRRGLSELTRSKNYEKLALSIPCGICRIENFENGKIIFANDFYYNMFGYTRENALTVGFTSADFTVLPEDLFSMKEHNKTQEARNVTLFETEARHITSNGIILWVLSRYKLDSHSGEINAVMIDITDRKLADDKLRISEEEYRLATQHSNKLIVRLDIRSRTSYRQPDTSSIFGVPPVVENVPESIVETGAIAVESEETFKAFFDAIYNGERDGSAVVCIYNESSQEDRWYHFDFTSIFDDDNKPVQSIISFYDVTVQREKELAFQRWQQSYNAIPKSAATFYEYNLSDDVFENTDGSLLPPLPQPLSTNLSSVAGFIAKNYIYREDMQGWLAFMNRDRLLALHDRNVYSDKMEFRRLSGRMPLWTSIDIQMISDPYSCDVKCYFLLQDIDEQKKAEIYLKERSMRDSLTGLLNRGTFIEKLTDLLQSSSLETQHALIMLDVDNFKEINDSMGHNVGDDLLVKISEKLKLALRADDLCGRLGGDEFVIFLRNININRHLDARVKDLCHLLLDNDTSHAPISASFGVSCFPSDGHTFDELYQKADIALYKAKKKGRGGYIIYDPQLSFDDLSVQK